MGARILRAQQSYRKMEKLLLVVWLQLARMVKIDRACVGSGSQNTFAASGNLFRTDALLLYDLSRFVRDSAYILQASNASLVQPRRAVDYDGGGNRLRNRHAGGLLGGA